MKTGAQTSIATTPGRPSQAKPGMASSFPAIASIQRSHYRLRLAENEQDVRSAQLLRFVVFNLELNEGLEQSYATCLDADEFDPVCDHLLVEDVRTNDVIGTYRLQTGKTAAANLGYYSAQEFDFTPYESLRNEMVEVGRACVHADHRNLTVVSLLWKGIGSYLIRHQCRYMLGCSSLTSQDASVGLAAYRDLQRYLVREDLRTVPLPAYSCEPAIAAKASPKIPKLLSAYLMLGANICGLPALDREFKTIDFLTFLDLNSLTPKILARYVG